MRRQYPEKKIEIWAEDEARLGLQPVIRRQWFKKASKPRSASQTKYEWIYVYGFVEPATGKTHWLLLPTVNLELMQIALDSFAKEYISSDTIVVLLWDQAGFHQVKKLRIPQGLEILPLPPYTPELQPAERLWPSLRESIANRWISSLDQIEKLLCERIKQLLNAPLMIQRLTGFQWILNALNDTS